MEGKYLCSKGNIRHVITDSVISQNGKRFQEIDMICLETQEYQGNNITNHDELQYFSTVLWSFIFSHAVYKLELRSEFSSIFVVPLCCL